MTALDPSTTDLAELTLWAAATYGSDPAVRDGDTTLTYASPSSA